MLLSKKKTFLISLAVVLSLFFAPVAEGVYAGSLFGNLKEKASGILSANVKKYTSRDFWVDKTAETIATKVVSKPVKLAAAALGTAVGAAIGGPAGAALGAYLGNKIGGHACKIVGKPIVKGIIYEKLDNGSKITPSSLFRVCRSLDVPSLACNTTGAVIGDILGSAIGGITGAAIMACVGGATVLPIIGTITFATLGSKYGEKLGTWLGKKIGENSFNHTYKALTGIDRTTDGSADRNAILATIDDVNSVDKTNLARTTTAEVIGDVIGSALGAVAGATITACCGGGALTPILGSASLSSLGSKCGSKLGTQIGKWLGTNVFNGTQKVLSDIEQKHKSKNTATIGNNSTAITFTISDEIPVSASLAAKGAANKISDADAAFLAYQIAYDNYAAVLADEKATIEEKQQRQKEYNACYEQYRRLVSEKKKIR